jgi:hypothetical protein
MDILHEDLCTFLVASGCIVLIVRNISEKYSKENQNISEKYSNENQNILQL